MMPHPTSARRRVQCLNGWWDFLPLAEPHPPVTAPPRTGWLKHACLVPSWWNKPLNAVRRKGVREFVNAENDPGQLAGLEQYEYLFDAYSYPAAWTNAKAGWLRRMVNVEALQPGRRLQLVIEAAAPQCVVFLNGQYAGRNTDAMLPLTIDITGMVHAGDNELAVLIFDYDRDERGRTLTPSGNSLTATIRGIWQNVWLVERSDLYVSDVTIRTSTRTKTLTVYVTVANDADAARMATCVADVTPWRKGRALRLSPKVGQVFKVDRCGITERKRSNE